MSASPGVTSTSGRWIAGLLAFARAAARRDFVEGLIDAQDALGLVAFEQLAERMAASESGRRLLADKPRLRLLESADELRQLPPGTLGHAIFCHLAEHGLLREPVIGPSRYRESEGATYAKARWRETHDLRHALLGLRTSVPDETLLHAFQLGQHFNPFSLIIVLFGPLYGWREQSPLVTWSKVPEAYEAGRRASLTAAVRFEEHLDAPLEEVRKRLGVRSLAHLCSTAAEVPRRSGKALLKATAPYAREQVVRSWWHLAETAVPYALGLALAVLGPVWPIQLVGSAVLALTALRLFAFLHDYEHGAIFRGSRLAPFVVEAIGVLTCIPPRVWRAFHSRHHRTTAQVLPVDQPDLRGGDFINRVVDAEAWAHWSPARQRTYRIVRHPVTMALGWLVNFVLGACVTQLLRDPVENRSAAFTLAAHLAWLGGLAWAFGPEVFLFVGALPTLVGAAIGTWLIFVQHSFPGVVYQQGPGWDHVDAALHGSSFLDLPPVLRWFSGNVGYHHVHHLNPKIPFYRLPEVARAVPELGVAARVTLSWRDIRACHRVHAWDSGHAQAGPLPAAPAVPTVTGEGRCSG